MCSVFTVNLPDPQNLQKLPHVLSSEGTGKRPLRFVQGETYWFSSIAFCYQTIGWQQQSTLHSTLVKTKTPQCLRVPRLGYIV